MIRLLILGIISVLSINPPEVRAQSLSPTPQSPPRSTAFYQFAEPGDLTMRVRVWGDAIAPGLYQVPQGMTLGTLLTLAGGPNTARTSRQDVTLRIRLMRDEGGRKVDVFQVEMENGIVAFEGDPVLAEGDTMVLERIVKERFVWRDALSVIGAAASVGSLVVNVVRLSRR